MELRKVLKFNKTLGLTLPVGMVRALNLHWSDYVVLTMPDNLTIAINKHFEARQKVRKNGK